MVSGCIKKKTPLIEKRPPIGNDFFLTQNPNIPDTQNDQDSASSEREYYDFNPYNETVTYYKEPTPKEVFVHHHKKNVFNMQQHIKQQNHESQVSEHKKPEEPAKVQETTQVKSSNQHSEKNLNQKPTTASNKVVLKPRKKMGLVKIIPKETLSNTNDQGLASTSTSNSGQAPIQPVILPNTTSKDSISIDEALKYIKEDLPSASSSNNTATSNQQQSSKITATSQTTTSTPIVPNTNSVPTSNTSNTAETDDNPENKPIPLPFN